MEYSLSPHHKHVESFQRMVKDLDAFIRLHYYGFPAMTILLGAVSVSRNLHVIHLVILLSIAMLFNIYSYVQNDVIDLPVDRTQEKRHQDPLVRGSISPALAMMIALLMFPLSLLITYLADAPLICHGLLFFAFGGMAIYNLWGKICIIPLITDFIEGAAWGSLAFYGACFISFDVSLTTYLVFAYSLCYIFLINGIHGGLRDLANDRRCGKKTAAIYLGAIDDEYGNIKSSVGVIAFSFFVFITMSVISGLMFFANIDLYSHGAKAFTIATLLVVLGWSSYLMWLVVKPQTADRDRIISRHMFVLLLPPIIIFVPQLPDLIGAALIAAFFLPLLAIDPAFEKIRKAISQPQIKA